MQKTILYAKRKTRTGDTFFAMINQNFKDFTQQYFKQQYALSMLIIYSIPVKHTC